MFKISIVLILFLSFFSQGCDEECDDNKFSSYCSGDILYYCSYDGGVENTSKLTVIEKKCSDRDPETPYCIEAQNEENPRLRASCVISKMKDPNCNIQDPLKSYCKNTSTHNCYYGYTTYVSGKGMCSE